MRISPFVLAIYLSVVARAEGPAPFMMLTYVGGEQLEGQPLAWDSEQMLLLGQLLSEPPTLPSFMVSVLVY